MGKKRKVSAKVIKAQKVEKAEQQTAQTDEGYQDVINPPYDPKALKRIVENSTILQQCITAYMQNICGFGTALQYREDETQNEETADMKAEWNRAKDFLRYFNVEMPFKDVWAQGIGDRETTGNGYIEIIRDNKLLPAEGYIVDNTTVKVTKKGDPVEIKREGRPPIYKRYRRYVQEINGKKIWFKEFGDPRTMNEDTGEYDENTPADKRANEILHLKIGNGAYGVPRWIGHVPHITGARKAEELNLKYFRQGRHTPLAVLVKNGMLTEESYAAIQEYIQGVEGADNAFKFLLLEVEGIEDENTLGDEKKPNVDLELKSLADILQKDALFLEYDVASRKKVQSAFRLSDLYVGYNDNLNRATAETARQLAEEQVFIPERESLEFIINNILLADYEFKYVDVIFNRPEVSSVEEKARLIDAFVGVGGIAPNDIRDAVGRLLGKELEPFKGDWANLPLAITKQWQTSADKQTQPDTVQKADNFIPLMKQMYDVLEELNDKIKGDVS
jgi:PBSX family phage portal protein